MEGKKEQALTVMYCWHTALNRAIKRNKRDAHSRFLQLATVRNDGSPAVRTLVFRKFQHDPAVVYMVTDSRSDKPAQIARNPTAEICWYFTRTREQFRLHGTLLITAQDSPIQTQRHEIWTGMSASARAQFYWPRPGRPLEISRDNPNAPDAMPGYDDNTVELPPANFLLLGLQVEIIDHLCLRGTPQSRWLSRRDDSDAWLSQAVNP